MFQLDSWYSVLFEMLMFSFSLYNSLRLTRWWNIVEEGAAVNVPGCRRVPSVASYYGIQSQKKQLSSMHKTQPKIEMHEMGDGRNTVYSVLE